MTSAPFVPGLELARLLHEEAVRPLLAAAHPGLRYAAALVGPGSEVLGLDTPRSTDHDWGPRLDLFLPAEDAARLRPALTRLFADRLPDTLRGRPTRYRTGDDPDGPVTPHVAVHDLTGWLTDRLGGPLGDLGPAEWLGFPQQRLAEVTGGAVLHDGTGELTAVRAALAWYPDQVWRHLLACQWQRIAQEEAFTGRCAEVGDELGSAVTAGRLVRDLMRLCLLLERRYAPYGKWLGSAFARLAVAPRLTPSLRGALAAGTYPERERHLCAAYETVAALHNATGLTPPVDPATRPYHSRPYRVLRADRFVRALAATVTDPLLRSRPLTGGVDQWVDSTDALTRPALLRARCSGGGP
ncbi:DUF4037 domain-containing protein [Kitasatospora sp. NPDC015120]|uniref:DUF4037 domain-containing protein n=1 Tax=Kitasatospora sp. NPDC015120 TaxID=3364023 RepID=UPI0036F48078